jgi:predicted restriction endonuclease
MLNKKQRLRKKCDDLWKKIILERHNYRCEICGGNWHITAHHFYFKSKKGHLRNDLDNGICLCGKCHASLHWKGQDQKLVEDKIIKIRGKKWREKLRKKAEIKMPQSYETLTYYQNILKKLNNI